jgi:hypothetical protein
MLKMQHYPFGVIEIFGEGMQSLWRVAPTNDGVANLGRKAVNVLRVVTIFRVIAAAFCGQLTAR